MPLGANEIDIHMQGVVAGGSVLTGHHGERHSTQSCRDERRGADANCPAWWQAACDIRTKDCHIGRDDIRRASTSFDLSQEWPYRGGAIPNGWPPYSPGSTHPRRKIP